MFDDFQIIAHRGWPSKYPENTLEGFKRAIDAGATMIEFDIQLTDDLHLAVFHDETMSRLCKCNKKISHMNRSELADYTVDGEPIPFLDNLFHEFGNTVNYYIELKAYRDTVLSLKQRMVYFTLNEITKHSLRNNCLIASSSWECIRMANNQHYYKTAYITDEDDPYIKSKIRSVDYKTVKEDVTDTTIAWTVNDKRTMKSLIKKGVSGIVTDHVDRLYQVYQEMDSNIRSQRF